MAAGPGAFHGTAQGVQGRGDRVCDVSPALSGRTGRPPRTLVGATGDGRARHADADLRRAGRASEQCPGAGRMARSEEHTSELQSLMRSSYAVFCLKNKKTKAKTKN